MDFAAAALRISSGIVVWALHFTAIYGATALACARGRPDLVPAAIDAATAVAVVLLVAIGVRGWRRRAVFEWWMSAAVAAFALVGVLFEALPVLWVPACR